MCQTESPGDLVGVIGMHLEGDVDRCRALVFVLDFGFRQRRATIETPVDRFQSLVEVAFLKNRAERTDFVGLGLEIHRQVGIVPLAENAEADEIPFLALYLLGSEGATELANLIGWHMLAMQLLDLMLDGQAMAVPAGDVGRIEPGQRLRTNDDVLENLVDCVADVNVAVGVGGAIVQHEARTSLRCSADALIETAFLPGGNPLRFAAGKVATHRKRRVGEVEGFLVVGHRGSHNWK